MEQNQDFSRHEHHDFMGASKQALADPTLQEALGRLTDTLTGDGSVGIQLTVSDGKGGSTTDSRTITLGNMSGRWTFIFTDKCSPYFPPVMPILTLTQTGRVITGELASPGNWCNVPAGQAGKLDPLLNGG